MTDFTTSGKELQGQILDMIRKSQETMTDAIRTWASTVQSMTPSLPVPSAPFADRLPKPADVVASAYDFAEQLLASQRKFAENVLDAAKPLLPGQPTAASKTGTASTKSGPASK